MTHLIAKGITVTAGAHHLLDAVDLDIKPGALIGLIGPNGAGKSTLLRTLAGLSRPQAGVAILDGRPVVDLPPRERTRRIGYLPQTFQPAWDYNVRTIVELGASRMPGAERRLDEILCTHDLVDLAERPWSRISGGERARALLAATMIAEPEVLLADEPGASLDIGHRIGLIRRLHAYARDRIVVLVLHDIEQAVRDCDRLVLLGRGRIVGDGPVAEIARGNDLDHLFGVRFARTYLDAAVEAVLLLKSEA
ncbi:iron complex transport system ATP-binding protein [Methylobacterium sp. RAS18]|nr:iron complex transport system ATP-binding protein [Methylobacterium sp. RAS18]